MKKIASKVLIVTIAVVISGCGSTRVGLSGLSLDFATDGRVQWKIKNVTWENVLISRFTGSESVALDCHFYRGGDGCEVTIAAIVISPPPEKCDGWEIEYKDFQIPTDDYDHDTWHIEADPIGCYD